MHLQNPAKRLISANPLQGQANIACPLKISLVFSSGSLQRIFLETAKEFSLSFINEDEQEAVIDWFKAYLEGTHLPFPLPLSFECGSFTKKVLDYLYTIPIGEVQTYGEIARALGNPKAARAVGNACHINPFPLVIPCHRVVRGNQQLGGFAFGLSMKETLLQFEKEITQKEVHSPQLPS